MTCVDARTLAQEWKITHVVIEGDAKQVVQAINGEVSYADCDSVILDCTKLASKFSSCIFTHVQRDCNKIAHVLAKRSLLVVRFEIWWEAVPSWLSALALEDSQADGLSISKQ